MQIPKSVGVSFILLGVLLIGTNLTLVRKNRSLSGLNRAYEESLQLHVGVKVPTLSGTDPSGNHVGVSYRDGQPKALLLVYSPSCGACTVNWPFWQQILRHYGASNARVVAVSMEESGASTKYLSEVGIRDVEVVLMPDPDSVIAYQFRLTPQTILIGPASKVEGVWSGLLNQKEVSDIEQHLL